MPNAVITINGSATHVAPAALLGQNLEMFVDPSSRLTMSLGLLNERLRNPKFLGPADLRTGLAPEWSPGLMYNDAGVRYDLTPGMFLSGTASQMLQNYSGRTDVGPIQTDVVVHAGETLVATLWARMQHHPVTVNLGLRPLSRRDMIYASGKVLVDTAYWKEYRVTLPILHDDAHAVFFCHVQDEGLVWVDQVSLRPVDQGPLRADFLAQVQALQVPILRFPGGCLAAGYHWRSGVGPAHLRPPQHDPTFKGQVLYEFGTDEYLDLCLRFNITPVITVNITSGTPEEAGEWAGYVAAWYRARGKTPPLVYWMIGCEHHGAWEHGNMSGEQYADLLAVFAPPIRAAYPAARIIALGVKIGYGLRPGEKNPWREPVLQRSAAHFDVLGLLTYSFFNPSSNPYAMVFTHVRRVADELRELIADCHAHGVPARVAQAEWNLWTRALHCDGLGFFEPDDAYHTLFASAMLHEFVRLAPDLEFACIYHLLQFMGVLRYREGVLEATSMAALFALYRSALPGRVLPLTVNSPALDGDIQSLDAIGLETSAGRVLFLVNRHPQDALTVEIAACGRVIETVTLQAAELTEPLRPAACVVQPGALVLPPLSVTRVSLSAAD